MQQIPSAKWQRLTPRGLNSQPKQTPSEHHLCSQAPMQGMRGAQQEPALDNCPLESNGRAAHPREQCLPPTPHLQFLHQAGAAAASLNVQ